MIDSVNQLRCFFPLFILAPVVLKAFFETYNSIRNIMNLMNVGYQVSLSNDARNTEYNFVCNLI